MRTTTQRTTDQAQFTDMMQRTYRKVYNLAFRLSTNRQDAEDLTQEAYYRAFRSFKDYEGDRPFENWIFRIVTHLYLDLNRARKRRVRTFSYDEPKFNDNAEDMVVIEPADDSMNAESVLMDRTVSEELEEAINTLKPAQRKLVIMADLQQLPYQVIASSAGIQVGTLRSRLHRAHKTLRLLLERGRKTAPSSTQAQCKLSTRF